MICILYATASADLRHDCRGIPPHDAAFVLNRLRPVLQDLGQVVTVSDPASEVDAIYDDCHARGEDCIFICVAPPHRAPVDLRCPTVCVFAWEYDRIPDEVWDDEPRNDWRTVLSAHGRAITLSEFAADVVRKSMGPDFPVAAIALPLADGNSPNGGSPIAPHPEEITVRGVVVDSSNCRMTPDTMEWIEPAKSFHIEPWSGETLLLTFTQAHECPAYLDGFYESESWGTWSGTATPGIVLPYLLKGRITVKIRAFGYGPNAGRDIVVSLGDQHGSIRLLDQFSEFYVHFELATPTNILRFSGLDLTPLPRAYDCRSMGIGLYDVEISGDPGAAAPEASALVSVPEYPITLDGIVYTSVCDPLDELENWQDLVTAFCTAFQNVRDATLVLQMPYPSLWPLLKKLYSLLQRLSPFDCRVIALHGELNAAEYQRVNRAAHFYVTAAQCVALPVDMVAHMACGKPVVAPCHTALSDYVTPATAVIVDSGREPCVWPHDTRGVFKTMRHRINWQSLVEAYRRSYAIARTEPDTYRAMAESAWRQSTKSASAVVVEQKLHDFFAKGFAGQLPA